MTTHGFGKVRFERECAHIRPRLVAAASALLPTTEDAEDAVQDTLLKLWTVRERIADKTHFRNLAFSVVRNVCLNMLRSMAVRRAESLSDAMHICSPENPHSTMERQEQTLQAHHVWMDLPQRHRIIIHMKEVEGLSTEEIARLLGTTRENVRTRLSRARKEMLARWEMHETS